MSGPSPDSSQPLNGPSPAPQGVGSESLRAIQAQLGYQFKKPEILAFALNFDSSMHLAAHDRRCMEFIGTSALNLALTETIVRRAKFDTDWQELTSLRDKLTGVEPLCEIAGRAGLRTLLQSHRLDASGIEIDSTAREAGKEVASQMRMVLGAVYADRGWKQVKSVVENLYQSQLMKLLPSNASEGIGKPILGGQAHAATKDFQKILLYEFGNSGWVGLALKKGAQTSSERYDQNNIVGRLNILGAAAVLMTFGEMEAKSASPDSQMGLETLVSHKMSRLAFLPEFKQRDLRRLINESCFGGKQAHNNEVTYRAYAIFGAIYLDGDYNRFSEVISDITLLAGTTSRATSKPTKLDPIVALEAALNGYVHGRVEVEIHPYGGNQIACKIKIGQKVAGEGIGFSEQHAHEEAAREALANIERRRFKLPMRI